MSRTPFHPLRRHAIALTLAALGAGGALASQPPLAPDAPLTFIPGDGPSHRPGSFRARTHAVDVLVTPGGALLGLGAGIGRTALRLSFVGSPGTARLAGAEPLAATVNDFRGSDPSRWRTRIPTFARVEASDVYPGIDAVYYANGRFLEFDLVLQPGADPGAIRLRLDGAAGLAVDQDGDLRVAVAGGTVELLAPVVYQDGASGRRAVAGSYVVAARDEVAFELCGQDPAEPLVIDPVVVYSTFLGGSGPDGYYVGHGGIAVDGAGNTVVAGHSSSADFPITAGALQPRSGGGLDIVVTKFAPDGATLVWSTYLGGNGTDYGAGVALDADGNVYIAGESGSTDFPTTASAYQSTIAGSTDVVVAQLSPAGDAFLYGSYLGGSGIDRPRGRGLVIDAAGYAYVSGGTYSTNFPTTPNAYQQTWSGNQIAFLAKLDTAAATGPASLVYSTVIGSGANAWGVATDGGGRAYLTGYTAEAFPTTPGAFDRTLNGVDSFTCKIDTNVAGTAGLVYSTYLGGKNGDQAYNLAVNAAGEAFVVGNTNSSDFPTTASGYSRSLRKANMYDTFLTRLNASGSALVYSTYLGGAKSSNEVSLAVAIDPVNGHALVGGYTSSTDFPVTANALQPALDGSGPNPPTDGFLAAFNTSASGSASLVYSSYLGGAQADAVRALAIGPAGSWLVTGNTSSADFPVTPGAFDTTYGGNQDAFVYRQDL